MNTQDYKWITQGRDVIMAQCAQLSEAQLAQSHGFALDSVKDTLLHITKCYRNWIGSFLLHAFTYECHHQGQITAMLSLMGHTPNNTNIVLFDSL